MPTITIRETYDLSTAAGRLGLIGIHTPGSAIIRKLYPGLWLNYNKVKVNSCNVALACASMLPADPLQIGVESGEIAPQDLFNPILYRACSTDSFNTILNRMYGVDSLFSLQDGSIAFPSNGPGDPFHNASATLSEDVYYGLLSESGWKKAMPQSGLQMRDLVPLVYNVISNYGNAAAINNAGNAVADADKYAVVPNTAGNATSGVKVASIFRGHSFPMPALPTARGMVQGQASYVDSSGDTQAGIDNSWYFPYFPPTIIPKTYVGCVIIPPSKLHKLYFRMTISWSVSFFDPVSIVERGRLVDIQDAGLATYGLGFQMGDSKEIEDKMTTVESTVDTLDVDANMIMQS